MIQNSPLISICIPVYNSSKWLRETISSALNQSYKNIEIIIVDDGSTDNSWNIIREYQKKFPAIIKAFRQQNKGASSARNKALIESKGNYIQWLDSDDILAENKIQEQMKFISKNNDPFILHSSSFGIFYHSIKRAKFIKNDLWSDLSPVKWLFYHLKLGYYMFPAAWLVSRELTEIAGKWNEELSYNDDGEYFCRVVSHSYLVKFHENASCFYRKGSYNSLSRSLGKKKKTVLSFHTSINLCCDYLLKIDDSVQSREACIYALSYLSNSIKNEFPELYKENILRIKSLGGELIPPHYSYNFRLVKAIFGENFAKKIKSGLWDLKIKSKERFDYFYSSIFKNKL